MKKRITLGLAAMTIFAVCVSLAAAQEKTIKRADLPAPVEKTVAEQSKGATIKGFSTEMAGGKKAYEVELTVDGHGRDILMDERGTILEIEEQVAFASLPPSVKAGLTKAAGAGSISEVESLTKQGKLVAYEAVVKTGKKQSEVQVGPDGKALPHPE